MKCRINIFQKTDCRVLAFAFKTMEQEQGLTLNDENDLTFLGLISMMDPPRVESKDAVAECIKAGIKPIMISGDHKVTAAAIAKRIGILENMSEACEGAVIEDRRTKNSRSSYPEHFCVCKSFTGAQDPYRAGMAGGVEILWQ